jgi:hypothetical protein
MGPALLPTPLQPAQPAAALLSLPKTFTGSSTGRHDALVEHLA